MDGGSFNGRTTDSDSVNQGSNPCPPAKQNLWVMAIRYNLFFYHATLLKIFSHFLLFQKEKALIREPGLRSSTFTANHFKPGRAIEGKNQMGAYTLLPFPTLKSLLLSQVCKAFGLAFWAIDILPQFAIIPPEFRSPTAVPGGKVWEEDLGPHFSEERWGFLVYNSRVNKSHQR